MVKDVRRITSAGRRSSRPWLTRPEAALAAVAVVWGATFLTVQKGLAVAGPWSFVGVRFGVAALTLAGLSPRALRGLTRRELVVGTLVGLTLAAGYGLQTIGLQSLPSSTSAFLTALYVPLVPLLQWAVSRRAPSAGGWAGIVCAFGGLLLLTGATTAGLRLGTGEIVTLVGTLATTAEIVLIGHFAGAVDARRVTVVQLAVCALLAFTARPLTGEPLPAPSWTLAAVAGGLGVATAVIQVTINWAQRSVAPTKATVLYAGEPVWAALIGRLAGERLSAASLTGGALIVFAVLVSELRLRSVRSPFGGAGGRQSARWWSRPTRGRPAPGWRRCGSVPPRR
jgi:drug/metabolite transporter (DMT)-like permease